MPKSSDRVPALSQAYISDSDGQEKKAGKKATKRSRVSKEAPTAVGGDSQPDSSTDSDEQCKDSESGSEEEEEEEEEEGDEGDDESEGESGSGSSSGSGSNEGDEEGQQSSDEEGSQSSTNSKRARQEDEVDKAREDDQKAKRQKNNSSSSAQVSRKSFEPPRGYKPLVLKESDLATESSEMFSALDAKQVWHISAPGSVNLESIKELDLEAVLRGEPILSEKNGVSYSMQELPSEDSTLILPRGASGVYRPSSAKVTRSFRLAVKAGAKASSSSSSSSSSTTQQKDVNGLRFVAQRKGQKKGPRQQPEGLNMRYQPFGSETKAPSTAAQQQSSGRKKTTQTTTTDDVAIADPMLTPAADTSSQPPSTLEEEAATPSKRPTEDSSGRKSKSKGKGKLSSKSE